MELISQQFKNEGGFSRNSLVREPEWGVGELVLVPLRICHSPVTAQSNGVNQLLNIRMSYAFTRNLTLLHVVDSHNT